MITFLKRTDCPDDVDVVSVCCSAPPCEYSQCCSHCKDHTSYVAVDQQGNELGHVDINDF